jgi:hypothetical protein
MVLYHDSGQVQVAIIYLDPLNDMREIADPDPGPTRSQSVSYQPRGVLRYCSSAMCCPHQRSVLVNWVLVGMLVQDKIGPCSR